MKPNPEHTLLLDLGPAPSEVVVSPPVVDRREKAVRVLASAIALSLLLLTPARGQEASRLSSAVRRDDCEEVARLLRPRPGRFEAGKGKGGGAFLRAVESGDVALVQLFVDCGVDINRKSADGMTPLMVACRAGNFEIVKILNVPGIDINTKNSKGWTALHFAASSGCRQTAEFLMEKGADVNARTINNTTPLSIAVVKNRQGVADLIKAYGGLE